MQVTGGLPHSSASIKNQERRRSVGMAGRWRRAESIPSEPLRRLVSSCSIIAHMVMGFDELGRRIADARRDLGLTQQECAAKAHLRRSSLAKIETGTRGVSALELARLADALEMRIAWFFEDAPPAVVSRRSASETGIPSPEIDRYVERVAREVTFLRRIIDSLELPTTPGLPVPRNSESAEQAAIKIRDKLELDDREPAIDLERRAAKIGLLVFSLDLDRGAADGASILLDRGGVAVINGNRDIGRRRLTLAHELGHFVFADKYSTDWNVAETSTNRIEAFIDRFARALLLPAAALRECWRGDDATRTDAVLIAGKFRVDMSTLARRLTELELASADDTAVVRATVTRRADIVEHDLLVPTDLTPPYLPTLYVKSVLDTYRREDISAARALELLLDTWVEEDLPELPMLPTEAIWSFVS